MTFLAVVEGDVGGWHVDRGALTEVIRARWTGVEIDSSARSAVRSLIWRLDTFDVRVPIGTTQAELMALVNAAGPEWKGRSVTTRSIGSSAVELRERLVCRRRLHRCSQVHSGPPTTKYHVLGPCPRPASQ